MVSNYSEYSRLRDIAHKRVGRLHEAGLAPDLHIPTVKELRSAGISAKEAVQSIQKFLNANTKVSQVRKLAPEARPAFVQTSKAPIVTTKDQLKREQALFKQRERNRRYRERVREIKQLDEKNLLKGAATLGLHLKGTAQKKAWIEYAKYRFAQGKDSLPYAMVTYKEDFQALVAKKGFNADQIIGDFHTFLTNRAELEIRADNMVGIGPERFEQLFSEYAQQ